MAITRAIQLNKSSTGDSTAPSTNMTVPKPLPWRPEGILADASSRSLFEYYILNTANVLVSSRKADNPFLSCVLPRALSDDLILNCVLAMTGAHRAYADADHKYNYLYRKHYALALSQLRREISHSDAGQSIRFLLATLLLTLVEAINGNDHGAAALHLRASQPLVSAALTASSSFDNDAIKSFLVEWYVYLNLVSNFTFKSDHPFHGSSTDHWLPSLEHIMQQNSSSTFFGLSQGLFRMIPSICALGQQRLQERNQGTVSFDSYAKYASLERRICTWQTPAGLKMEDEWAEQLSTAADVHKHVLLIFLHSAFHGSPVADDEIMTKLQPELDSLLLITQRLLSYDAQAQLLSNMLWPLVIVGSWLSDPDQQQMLRDIIAGSPFRMALIDKVMLLLELLWNQESHSDACLFGPVGVQVIMERYNLEIVVA
ncbi:hypothetical protein LTS17_006675 [Exophiala oligosperma]